MLVQITNNSGTILNDLDVHDGGSGATGGQRKYPLPYPFGHIGALANAGTKTLPVSESDWNFKIVPYLSTTPRQDWMLLMQKSWIALAFTVEVTQDPEEIFLKATIDT